MKALTESQALLKLSAARMLNTEDSLDQDEVYKACVLLANSGKVHPEEQHLSSGFRALLGVRRDLSKGDLSAAEQSLDALASLELSLSLEGDRVFLQGILAHRRGHWELSQRRIVEAAKIYRDINDTHRLLRAQINVQITRRDVDSYQCGELYSLERLAARENYYDLVGNIQKARAVELAGKGEFAAGLAEIHKALESYSKDGCPEDRALSLALAASLNFIDGNSEVARNLRSQIEIASYKVTPYIALYESLVAGRNPQFASGHALHKSPWPVSKMKGSSVTGKIISKLREGPSTRDALIESVWGKYAVDPSYCSRLYTAINHIRKKMDVVIRFDGELYRID